MNLMRIGPLRRWLAARVYYATGQECYLAWIGPVPVLRRRYLTPEEASP